MQANENPSYNALLPQLSEEPLHVENHTNEVMHYSLLYVYMEEHHAQLQLSQLTVTFSKNIYIGIYTLIIKNVECVYIDNHIIKHVMKCIVKVKTQISNVHLSNAYIQSVIQTRNVRSLRLY